MSKRMAGIIMVYGGCLAALGFAVRGTATELAQVPFLTGLAGGGVCVLWGGAAWFGYQRRVWVILTMILIAFFSLGQAVPAWLALATKSGNLAVALLTTLMLAGTLGMIMYVMHGERSAEFYERNPRPRNRTQPESTSGKNRQHH